ncbi:serine hydrolase domain-containing protein [Streptomyces marincola]|uniref:Beta-lactamase n=1 Tax=Streptomyces marincola TaxID=2878388 RepID=A0A1W7CX63_9ACTN|nr:serine hydrolase domain-containing protein [Streptomyces marincola]ARQ69325.1 serine hydrolase [Streptomyces marincola]
MTAGTHGDQRLVARLGELLGPRHPVAAAAVVTPEGTRVASRGAGLDADFEIGSIAKAVTGLLYADALARGEIDSGTRLGELLPLGGAPAGRVTLRSLSTHSSGLPRLPASARPWRRTVALWRHGANPYGEDLEQLLDQARGVPLGTPRPRYSNLGFQLLGHALARAATTTYPELVRQRVATPLGLDCFSVPRTADELRPGALAGSSRRGRPRQPWTGEGIGPAGGIRASITDMARFAAAVLDGSAPGIAALDPVAPFGSGARIGAAWITVRVKGRPVTWHNGGTGGFRSWLGLDRGTGTGVVILSATAASVDRQGFALLAEHGRGDG